MTKEKLNIAFVTDLFHPDTSGVVTYLNITISELAKRGHEITVYTHSKAVDLFNKNNVNIIKFPSIELPGYRGLYGCIPNPFKLRKHLIAKNPDVVHVHSPYPGPLVITAMIVAKRRKIPVMGTLHGFVDKYHDYWSFFRMLGLKPVFGRSFVRKFKAKMPTEINDYSVKIKRRLIWGIIRAYYNNCDLVAVPSKLSAKRAASHGIPCMAIPYGVDVDTFRVKRSYARTGRILSVCRIGYEKRLDILIRAFSIFLKKHPNAKLTLVGDGPARESLVELTRNLGLQNRVSFEGMIKRSELQKYFDTHDFFANASDSETFGYVTAEAMAGGLPIVAVNAQGSKDLVRNRINGFLAKPNSIEDFARAMERMMEKESDLKGMGAASRRLVQKFSVKKAVDNHIKAYNRLIKNNKN